MERKVSVTSPPYRSGTQVGETRISLIFNSGGIGDYINWVTPIRYAIKSNPHISGYIVTQPYFADLAHFWFDDFDPRFIVREVETDDFIKLDFVQETAAICPNAQQYASACSHNLFDLGFIYYCQIDRAPLGWETLPSVTGDEVPLGHLGLPRDYVVVTPNATADNRRMTPECINGLLSYFKLKGLTPVLLGKRELASDYRATSEGGLDLTDCLDLREKTSLREAACVMAKSRLTVGLDNGLLHLASCGPSPVAWVFTSVDPRLRLPPRPDKAKTISIAPSDNLACRFCQSRMRYIIGHKFSNCLYGDNLCVTELRASYIIKSLEQLGDLRASD